MLHGMAVRSTRLTFVPNLLAGNVNVYECPPGRTALVKSAVWHNAATTDLLLAIAHWSPDGSINLFRETIPAGTTKWALLETQFVVLEPGHQLRASNGAGTSGPRLAVYGALLEGAPE